MKRFFACLAGLGLVLALGGTSRANPTITNVQLRVGHDRPWWRLRHSERGLDRDHGMVGVWCQHRLHRWLLAGLRWPSASIDLDGNAPGGLTASTNFNVVAGTTYQRDL